MIACQEHDPKPHKKKKKIMERIEGHKNNGGSRKFFPGWSLKTIKLKKFNNNKT